MFFHYLHEISMEFSFIISKTTKKNAKFEQKQRYPFNYRSCLSAPVEKIGGFEEVNNRKGIFYIKGVEAEGVPVVLKVLHHCYENPVEVCSLTFLFICKFNKTA